MMWLSKMPDRIKGTAVQLAWCPVAVRFLLVSCSLALVVGCDSDPSFPVGNEGSELDPWLLENADPINSLTSQDYADLQFLKTRIGNRRVVQLGESGHGVREFNRAKVRLIRFLHEEMGFDVVAFESSVFEYILSTKETPRPITLAGFDMKPNSWAALADCPAFMREVVARLDAANADTVHLWKTDLVELIDHGGWKGRLAAEVDTFRGFYAPFLEFFDIRLEEQKAEYPQDPEVPMIARQIVWATLIMIQMVSVLAQEGCQTFEVRDRGMAENLRFLADHVYADKKIIVWAHNE